MRILRHAHPTYISQKTPRANSLAQIGQTRSGRAKGAGTFKKLEQKAHISGMLQDTTCYVRVLQVDLLAWVWSIASRILCGLTIFLSKYWPSIRRGLHILYKTWPSKFHCYRFLSGSSPISDWSWRLRSREVYRDLEGQPGRKTHAREEHTPLQALPWTYSPSGCFRWFSWTRLAANVSAKFLENSHPFSEFSNSWGSRVL